MKKASKFNVVWTSAFNYSLDSRFTGQLYLTIWSSYLIEQYHEGKVRAVELWSLCLLTIPDDLHLAQFCLSVNKFFSYFVFGFFSIIRGNKQSRKRCNLASTISYLCTAWSLIFVLKHSYACAPHTIEVYY